MLVTKMEKKRHQHLKVTTLFRPQHPSPSWMEPLLYTIDAFLVFFTIGGHIDVVDGCLERNLVVTTIDVGDGFGHFGNQHPLSFYISVGHQHSKYVTDFKSSTSL